MQKGKWHRLRVWIKVVRVSVKWRPRRTTFSTEQTAGSGGREEHPSGSPKFRDISPEALDRILEAHRSWLDSDGKEGQQADLSGVDLSGIDLPGADLRGANLQGANMSNANLAGANLEEASLASAILQRANLRGCNLKGAILGMAYLKRADLTGAYLEGANLGGADLKRACLAHAHFREANLHQARFWDADLRDAELAEAHEILGAQLAGANLSGAKLPAAIASFDGLSQVRESAEIARPMFIMMLLVCLYAFATISSTTDAALLANFPSEFLPDVSVPIPTVLFFLAMPFLVFCLYVYLHLYIEQLWREVSCLPSVFPDGTVLHRMIYPWLLIRLLARVASNRSVIFGPDISVARGTINVVFIAIVWWLVPITLLFFGVRYLPAHDWRGMSVHIVLIMLAIGSGGFGIRAFGPIQAARRDDGNQVSPLNIQLFGSATYRGAIAAVVGVVLVSLSYGAIHGVPPGRQGFGDARTWVPYGLSLIGFSPFADFREANVSIKPANWRGGEEEIGLVEGADLRGRDLQYLQGYRAFLVGADLRNADLSGADLTEVDLRNADLREASLQDADLKGADLSGADLRNADLRGTYLAGAILVGADLRAAKLERTIRTSVNLRKADLRNADLSGANLEGADLSGAYLQDADLSGGNLRNTDFHDADLQRANLRYADLRKADLRSASLQNARLGGANLQEADLRDAILRETGLPGADLSGAKLRGADLASALLQGADLPGADLRDAKLQSADLRDAKLQDADLSGAKLQDADLSGAKLQDADLSGANLLEISLAGADLQRAILRDTNLQAVDLSNASLQNADLVNANLGGVVLRGADLSGANLKEVRGLTQEQLDQACGDESTQMPPHLTVKLCL